MDDDDNKNVYGDAAAEQEMVIMVILTSIYLRSNMRELCGGEFMLHVGAEDCLKFNDIQ